MLDHRRSLDLRLGALDLAQQLDEFDGAQQLDDEFDGAADVDFDEFDEEARFEVHRKSHVTDSLARLKGVRGVISATVVEVATGDVVLSTTELPEAAALATHVPAILHRAKQSLGSAVPCRGCGRDECEECALSLLMISTRKCEYLVCADSVSGTAVVVEQDRLIGPDVPERADASEEVRVRRLLAGLTGEMLSPGSFVANAQLDEEQPLAQLADGPDDDR